MSSVVAPSFSPIKSIDADSEYTVPPLHPLSVQGDIAIPSCTTPTASNHLCLVSASGDIAIPSCTTPTTSNPLCLVSDFAIPSYTTPTASNPAVNTISNIVPSPLTPINSFVAANEESVGNSYSTENNQQGVQEEVMVSLESQHLSGASTIWNDVILVGNNIDKKYRQSFHRVNKKPTSIHYFHFYAVRDRIDLSSCSETLPNTKIDVDKLMIALEDLKLLNNDVIVLMSRLVMHAG